MPLDHERLTVYQRARELNREIHSLAARVPRGHAAILDQIRRSSASVTLNIAEGAGEFAAKEKIRFYRIARRSATEVGGSLDTLVDQGALGVVDIARAKGLVEEIVAMLIAMVKGLERRGGSLPGEGGGEGPSVKGGARARARGRGGG